MLANMISHAVQGAETAAVVPAFPGDASRSSPDPAGDPPPAIDGLLFEMAGVLYDATLWRRWMCQVLARLGVAAHFPEFFAAWDAGPANEVYLGRRTFDAAFADYLATTGLPRSQVEELAAAAHARLRATDEDCRPLPHVKDTLGKLVEHQLPMGILTDSEHSAEELQAILQTLAIAPCFRFMLCSRALGNVKPDRAAYDAAARLLGVAPERIGFVGVAAAHLRGAQQAGLRAIGLATPVEYSAHWRLARFEDLLAITVKQSPPPAENANCLVRAT